MTSAYLRFPTVHGDQVAFVAADDLWLAPADGGRAWRLTDERVPVRTPRFSPDGAHLAYVSYRDGQPEVFVADVATGTSRRLTWWGATRTLVLGWDAQGRVVAASNAGAAHPELTVTRAVALDGTVETLPYGPAWGLAVSDDPRGEGGRVALVSAGYRTPAHWKRYRGGTATRLWLDRAADGRWERLLPDDPASVVDPMWVAGRLLFGSDRAARFPDKADEQANLWVWDVPGVGEPRQLTHQGPGDGYVRDATTDGTRVVWHSRGGLWVLDALDVEPRRIDVTVAGVAPRPVAASPHQLLTALAPDHGGDTSVVGWRGTAFRVTHRDGPVRALVADPSVRVRELAMLGATDRAVLVTDAEGEDTLEIHAVDGSSPPRRVASGELGRVLHLTADPAGERVATVSHDGRVSLVDVEAGAVRVLDTSLDGEAGPPAFSPDGRYLLWSRPTPTTEGEQHQLVIADLDGDGAATPLTSGTFHDYSPAFSSDGKYAVFLSDRTFDPEYDSHEFGLSFTGTTRPWLIPLAATEPAPFGPAADGRRFSKPPKDEPKDEPKDDKEPDDDGVATPDLDADGAEERVVPFPVASGRYRDLRPAKDGVLWVHEDDDAGVLGTRHAGVVGERPGDALEYWSFETRKVTQVASDVSDYAVSGDGERLVVRSGGTLTSQPATRAPSGDDDADTVEIDLGRLRHDVDLARQWHQMFDENARIMRDHFWRADMDGVDWGEVTARWRPLVERATTSDEFEDVLWETVGELNTSHAYVRHAGPVGDASRRLGLLGADLSPVAGGWRIDRVLPGESSDPDARSPLRAAGVDARDGDVIVAVDGRSVSGTDLGPALVGAAEQPVELVLRRADAADRRVVVVPLADESALRYQDWVRSRRQYVADRSQGRLGYVHIPDMTSSGWAQLHRDLRHAVRREGVVVDVRFNGGGHTSQLVIARLAQRVVGWGVGRHYASPTTYPYRAPQGPVVLVTNEYAGSDGDIVNAAAQALGVGPVVGVRTWGGVVGIDMRFSLVDGTGITQPRYAFWLEGHGFGVENHGVDPDIEVWHTPADYFSDDDPQLDRAMAEAFRLIEERPAARPPVLPEPKVRRG
ncbi:S41 family peptidase [Antribacter gilvus]|uniref:S41 family peptidase n=1 Tax=Antribacter gilvus TaxID=2304675 RepID=UPI000F7A5BBC|nr:S41 family peptidase [Antribacter gilvus]